MQGIWIIIKHVKHLLFSCFDFINVEVYSFEMRPGILLNGYQVGVWSQEDDTHVPPSKEGPGHFRPVITSAIGQINNPLQLVRIVGSDLLIQVLHEYNEHLRSCISLCTGVINSSFRVYSADQVYFWHQLFDWNAISFIAASPLPSGEAHVRQPTLVDRD